MSDARRHRLAHVDHLRSLVILGLILFHTARLFDPEPWHMKDAGRYLAADLLIAAFNIVQMPLLFFLAGMTARHSLATRSAGRFVAERTRRILLPFAVGILVVVAPQVYVERRAVGLEGRSSPIDFAGSYLDFLPGFFSCCYPAANFSWHHLWFLIYLFAYSLLLVPLPLALGRPDMMERVTRAGRWLAEGVRPLLLVLPLLAVEWLLRPRFPSTHALIDDFANHAHFLALILAGWWFAAVPELTRAAERRWPVFLGGAIVLAAMLLTLRAIGALPVFPLRVALRTLAEWGAILGLLGLFARHASGPVRLLDGFGRLSFPFYIFHQAVIVLLGYWLLGWSDAPLAKFLAIAAIALAVSLALSWAAGTMAITRLLFGMR